MKILKLIQDEEGQALTEYALIISLVVLVALVGLISFGGSVEKLYNFISGEMLPAFSK